MAKPRLDYSGDMIMFGENEPPPPAKAPLHEVLSRLILPALFATAAILGRAYHAVLFVFLGLALIGIYYEQLAAMLRHWRISRNDKRVAKQGLKELRSFSRDLGEFFERSTSRTDLLPGIMNELRSRHPELTNAALQLPSPEIFHSQWEFLNTRIQEYDLTPAEFHDAARELWSIIAIYSSQCVYPVFRTFPSEMRDILTAGEKSQLNAFQQKFVHGITSYITYLKKLNDDFHSFPELPTGIAFPHPL